MMDCMHQPAGDHLHVIVDETHGTTTVKTEEREAEHIVVGNWVLPGTGAVPEGADTNLDDPIEILQVDPLRKRAVISITGPGDCFFAHSYAQAIKLREGGSGVATSDEGFRVTSPASFTVESTAALWCVASTSNNTPNFPAINTPSTPISATGAAASTTTLTIPAPGSGKQNLLTMLNWSFSAASTAASTLTITDGTTTLTQSIPVGATSGTFFLPSETGLIFAANQPITITLTSGGAAITSTLNAGYMVTISNAGIGSMEVSVLTERRTTR